MVVVGNPCQDRKISENIELSARFKPLFHLYPAKK
jgi:hypothetical protein